MACNNLNTHEPSRNHINVTTRDGVKLNLHYVIHGEGDPILLIHGWPTSSHLWRNVMPTLAKTHQVIAIDLPGFGLSDKPLAISYSFKLYEQAIDAFLNAMRITKTGLVVHDLGGPVGLMWALKHSDKVTAIGILNTLVYPEFSWAVKLFVLASMLPGVKHWLGSQKGLEAAIKLGVNDPSQLKQADLASYYLPFISAKSRKALMKTVQGLSRRHFARLGKEISQINKPVRLIYGENDRILPDIAKTMTRLKEDLPNAELTCIPGCGHFLQEDKPELIGQYLSEFFNQPVNRAQHKEKRQ